MNGTDNISNVEKTNDVNNIADTNDVNSMDNINSMADANTMNSMDSMDKTQVTGKMVDIIPKVSIVTICFNEKNTIRDTMRSVLCQDFTDFEYIIKDGGSTDDTLKIINGMKSAFLEKGIRIDVISGKDKGLYDAMNQAVTACRGEWVNFMNSGDRFFDGKVLSNIFSSKDYSNADLIYGDAVEEEYGEYYFYRKCPKLIKERMPFNHQTVFARRELLLSCPFDLSLKIGADYDFLLKCDHMGKVFKDSNVVTAMISKEGVSTLKLKDTYLESINIRKRYGIPQPEGKDLKRKLVFVSIKQFVMDHFPSGIKYGIRKIQRRNRSQQMLDVKQLPDGTFKFT